MLKNNFILPYPVVLKLTLTKKKLCVLFACLLLLYPYCSFGNHSEIDSLLALSKQTRSQEQKADILYEIARKQYATDKQQAILYGNQAYTLFLTNGNDTMAAKAINIVGAVNLVKGQYPAALEAFEEALPLAVSAGDSVQVAKILNNIGTIKLNQGELKQAIICLLRAGKIFTAFDLPEGAIAIENSLSSIYRSTGAYIKSHQHIDNALKLANEPGTKIHLGTVYHNLGALLIEEGRYIEALNANEKALQAKMKTQGIQSRIKTYINLGICQHKLQNYHASDTCYSRALSLAQKYHYIEDEAYVLMHQGFLNLESSQYGKADSLLELSLPMAEQINDRELQLQLHEYLYYCDSVSGYYKTALTHLQKASKIKSELQSHIPGKKLEELENLYTLAKQENKMQEHILQQKSTNIHALVAGIIILFLLAVLVLQQICYRSQKKMADLTQENLRSQMNPHFIFNILNSIHSFILKNNRQASSKYLVKFSRLLRLTLDSSQSKLVPLQDEIDALKLYLELENMRFDNQLEYKIIVDDEIDPLMFKIPALLLQPYVENSILHGLQKKNGRGKIEIRLDYLNKAIHCSITDNGIGIKKAEEIKMQSGVAHKSHGSRLTENRLKLLNTLYGKRYRLCYTDLSDINAKTSGTKVEFDLPIMMN